MRSLALFISFTLWLSHAFAQESPRHLVEAEHLLDGVSLADTNYEHGAPTVSWESPKACHTDCSGFIDALLMHTYHYDADAFKRWFNSHRPTAKRYYDAIDQQQGFTHLHHITDLHPGDILAVKYLKRADNTGHVMLADGFPKKRQATEPLVDGTVQWDVEIIDSSKTGHGINDRRHHTGVDGKDHDGLGRGVLRIYTREGGQIAGFSWSTQKASEFKGADTEPMILGRLVPEYKP